MLKNRVGDETWLITQPDHAAVSGYLAEHWGNEEFSRPGFFGDPPRPDELREAVVFAIAQHDNGWREWEADPEIDPEDGLPLHFLQARGEWAFERWERGAARYVEERPYESLLISLHGYWLHRVQYDSDCDDRFRHPIFGSNPPLADPDSEAGRRIARFLAERESFHEKLRGRIEPDRLQEESQFPHVRLLQTLDALSLMLGAGGLSPARLIEIPRASWSERVEIEIEPLGDGRLALSPYPFDRDPLPVEMPGRAIKAGRRPESYRRWASETPLRRFRFELRSGNL